jgi:hypothetical protein
MYQKYQTDAIVLASRELGEADKTYALFTRDFGLVRARASAVRREVSKMRYALQSYSLANVSLVRGKRGWRVAGARSQTVAPQESAALSAVARIAELTQKLVTGEDKNEYLFEVLAGAHAALASVWGGQTFPEGLTSRVATIEVLCVARMLFALGYISNEALKSVLFTHADYSQTDTQEASALRDKLLASINQALSETQLIRR